MHISEGEAKLSAEGGRDDVCKARGCASQWVVDSSLDRSRMSSWPMFTVSFAGVIYHSIKSPWRQSIHFSGRDREREASPLAHAPWYSGKDELILENSQLSFGREQSLPDFVKPPHLFSARMKGSLQFFLQRNGHVLEQKLSTCAFSMTAWKPRVLGALPFVSSRNNSPVSTDGTAKRVPVAKVSLTFIHEDGKNGLDGEEGALLSCCPATSNSFSF